MLMLNKESSGLTSPIKRRIRMKKGMLRFGLWTMVAGLLTTACATRHYTPVVATSTTGEVVVTETPPPPRREVIGVAPGPSYVWVRGYWVFRDHRWVWVPGHYQLRPRTTAVWVEGHWDHTVRGWVWTPGHWE
jgi:WXXGXW repeat (2 copies)